MPQGNTCTAGHHAHAVKENGTWHWACHNCDMTREQGQTEWRLP